MKFKEKLCLARKFRTNDTYAEKVLWEQIRDKKLLNLKFRRQYIIHNFIIDFFCFKYRLAIEVDGDIHKKQTIKDEKRQKIIESKKINFLRFTNKEILTNMKKVLSEIKGFTQRTEYPSPVTGEGCRGEDRKRGNSGGEDE